MKQRRSAGYPTMTGGRNSLRNRKQLFPAKEAEVDDEEDGGGSSNSNSNDNKSGNDEVEDYYGFGVSEFYMRPASSGSEEDAAVEFNLGDDAASAPPPTRSNGYGSGGGGSGSGNGGGLITAEQKFVPTRVKSARASPASSGQNPTATPVLGGNGRSPSERRSSREVGEERKERRKSAAPSSSPSSSGGPDPRRATMRDIPGGGRDKAREKEKEKEREKEKEQEKDAKPRPRSVSAAQNHLQAGLPNSSTPSSSSPSPAGATSAAPSSSSSPAQQRRRATSPSKLDSKEITIMKLLGEGTFGSVHAGLLNRQPVAVKIFKVFAAAELLANEWNILSQLNHPNIIRTYGYVIEHKVHDYRLVMELMDSNLEEYLRMFFNQRRQLPEMETLNIARQIASSMAYLHRNGIIHFDLKPQNILVCKHGRSER